ncbi:hypothetical protein [Robiginitalea sediminis]|uniref:hypothetical protein n=1 Tax=Robiginitalea sediminis TaxID=1982593 RepID=UPI0013033384|nr:hypothetical protein [Robiginitalea sediminis]
MTLEDGGTQTVDLSGYVSSDDQALSLSGNTLTLEDGGTVDLSAYLDNSDDQQITDFSLAGNILTLTLEDGGTQSVDLSGIAGTDDQTAAEVSYDNSTSAMAATTVQDALDEIVSSYTDDQPLADVLSEGNSAGNAQIRDLAEPTAAQDAATKNYVDNLPRVWMGAFRITGTGVQTISGLPFQPSSISFTAHANVEDYNLDSDNGIRNNERGIANSFGSMNGFVQDTGSGLNQQVIYVGGSGNSINDISRFSSSSHCIGLRYGDQNGTSLGITSATVTSLNADGFTINTDQFADGIVVLFQAYR